MWQFRIPSCPWTDQINTNWEGGEWLDSLFYAEFWAPNAWRPCNRRVYICSNLGANGHRMRLKLGGLIKINRRTSGKLLCRMFFHVSWKLFVIGIKANGEIMKLHRLIVWKLYPILYFYPFHDWSRGSTAVFFPFIWMEINEPFREQIPGTSFSAPLVQSYSIRKVSARPNNTSTTTTRFRFRNFQQADL